MKKIGVITHYYNSKNYGGVLQAYALCRYLNKCGYNAEQIQFDKERKNLRHLFGVVYRNVKNLYKKKKYKEIYMEIIDRNKKFSEFRTEKIPHSEEVYSQKKLKKLAKKYDLFITGSDQVWHPDAVCDAYLLDFDIQNIKKIAYAASIAKETLTEQECVRYQKALEDFQAISVREKNAIDLIQPIVPVTVKWTVDPVFLLRKEEWESLTKGLAYKKPYVFCYFLGNDKDVRNLAEQYTERKNLELKEIAHINGEVCINDLKFDAEHLIDVSPVEFINLIQNAEMILTDSFHAMVFSLIFQKQFVVFERSVPVSMGSRMQSLADLFDVNEHYCNCTQKKKVDYLMNVPIIDYKNGFVKFEKLRRDSINFLIDNINKCLNEG